MSELQFRKIREELSVKKSGGVQVPGTRPGKHTKNYGKSPFLMGKSTISMAIFKFANCKRLPEGNIKRGIIIKNVLDCHTNWWSPWNNWHHWGLGQNLRPRNHRWRGTTLKLNHHHAIFGCVVGVLKMGIHTIYKHHSVFVGVGSLFLTQVTMVKFSPK